MASCTTCAHTGRCNPGRSIRGDLAITSYTLDLRYNVPAFPLQIVARKITDKISTTPSTGKTTVSVLLAPSMALTTEHYIPLFKRLFKQCNNDPRHPVHIRSLWVVESPNHGDAAIINETAINTSAFATHFPCTTHSEAIKHVINELIHEEERGELVGFGHSAGCGIITGVSLMAVDPFKARIFIEPGLWTTAANPIWEAIVTRAEKMSAYRKPSWPSVEEAMEDLKQQRPYNLFTEEVLEAMAESSFVTASDGQVMTKTSILRELACMRAYHEGVMLSEAAVRTGATVPTHMITGERRDFWIKPLNAVIESTMNTNSSSMASVIQIPNAGHYPPQENPEESAKVLADVLARITTSIRSQKATDAGDGGRNQRQGRSRM